VDGSLVAEPKAGAGSSWPKQRLQLTERQHEVLEDWYQYWLPTMAARYSPIVRFNNQYSARTAAPGLRTLEIGAGLGEHLGYEPWLNGDYYALELREELAAGLRSKFQEVQTIVGDCQKRIDVPDAFFDRVLAIHVLEHLDNLPSALEEVARVLRPGGTFSVVIPCEGGLAYHLGRRFSSKRMFEKRYGLSYEWMISYEHINRASEILKELEARFLVEHSLYYPLRIPSVHLNLVTGLTLTRRG
jgi:SAM-dependent methyltransferase